MLKKLFNIQVIIQHTAGQQFSTKVLAHIPHFFLLALTWSCKGLSPEAAAAAIVDGMNCTGVVITCQKEQCIQVQTMLWESQQTSTNMVLGLPELYNIALSPNICRNKRLSWAQTCRAALELFVNRQLVGKLAKHECDVKKIKCAIQACSLHYKSCNTSFF